jgi:cell division protein FtsA
MRTHIAAGIDIGTHEVKVVVTESGHETDRLLPRVIGQGIAESKGLRHGYIVSVREAAKSVRHAVALAEKASGAKIKKATIAIGGISLQSVISSGSVVISRGDSEVGDMDIDKAALAAERALTASQLANRRIIHTIPLSYKIDGKAVFGRPQGMKGNKLEARVLFITCSAQHLDDLIETITEAGIEVLDVVASPIAASLVTLSKNQKVAGCVLAHIGAETVSMVVFEDNLPMSMEVFSLGSTDITNDIALGLKLPIEEADSLKRGGSSTAQVSKKKLDEIVEARLSDIFDLIEAHLKKIDRNGLLPAGIILAGGGAHIPGTDELAKDILKLPARVLGHKESIISVAYGLSMLGLGNDDDSSSSIGKPILRLWRKIKALLSPFLP